jgi:glucose-6-phosphate 1-dehydrogenase
MTRPPTVNPLRAGLRQQLTPEPCILILFGATGDLTMRKLLPALYNLSLEGLLPHAFSVVGVARRPKSDDDFRKEMLDAVNEFSRSRPVQPQLWETFSQGIFYVQSEFHDPEGFGRLKARLEQIDKERGTGGNHLYYMATPPDAYPIISANLGKVGLVARESTRDPSSTAGWSRIVVEKPFGRDLRSARELNRQLHTVFSERQIYRIDHYLGKETVQNLLVFRFGNIIFEPIWNQQYIDNVQITVAENIGIEGRASYYDNAGAIRDMVQNHMMQLLSLVCMEPPVAFDADNVRDEKVKVLRAIHPMTREQVLTRTVRAQYSAGSVNGQPVPGYCSEEGVNPDSITETYVAIKLFVDNWRWAGVPFYLRTGKRLPKRSSEVAIQFKDVPQILFNDHPDVPLEPTVLSLRVQPEEGLSMRIASKLPGPKVRIYPVKMEFNYSSSFGGTTPEAYERLILDVMAGDATLFMRRDGVEAAWQFVMPILNHWQKIHVRDLPEYQCGTWGPVEADRVIAPDGRQWRTL